MALTIPDYDDSLEDIKNDLLTEWPGADTADGSDHDSWARVESNLLEGAHARLAEVEKQILPTTCDADRLDEFGEAYNHPQGDDETDEEYRERIVALIQQPIDSGKDEDYARWAKAGGKSDQGTQVVTGVLVLSTRGGESDSHRGVGCVDVVVLQAGSGAGRIIENADTGAEVLQNVASYIDIHKPTGADVVVSSATAQESDIEGVVYFSSPAYRFDWDGYKAVRVINPDKKTITLNNTVGLQAGMRVVLHNEQRFIESVDQQAGTIVLTEELSEVWQGQGLPMGAGGPCWDAILAGAQRYFDGLAPLDSMYRSKLSSRMLVDGVDGVDLIDPVEETTLTEDTSAPPKLWTLGRLDLQNG